MNEELLKRLRMNILAPTLLKDAADEIESLQASLDAANIQLSNLAYQKDTARKERDQEMKWRLKAEENNVVVVPREPTRKMWAAMADAFVKNSDIHHDYAIAAIFKAMIAATEND